MRSSPPELLQRQREEMARVREAAARLFNTEMPELQDLWYAEERADVADWLRAHGWNASVVTAVDLATHYGRILPEGGDEAMRSNLFISAQRVTD